MKKILVVDDDPKIVRVLKIRLKAAHFAVLSASNGETGLHLALTAAPDLVILDMWMRVGSGASVAYRLREAAPQIPFIFLTASKDPQVRDTARKLGATDFFEKPYEFSRLLAAVERTLRKGLPPLAPQNPQEMLVASGDGSGGIYLRRSSRVKL